VKLTNKQRNSIYLYCERLGDALNDAGYDMKKTLKPGVDIPWSKMLVKEFLWDSVEYGMLHKDSVNDLERLEVSEVYEVLNRHIATNFGVSVPFPSEDELSGNQ
jgi:hypothetical protein